MIEDYLAPSLHHQLIACISSNNVLPSFHDACATSSASRSIMSCWSTKFLLSSTTCQVAKAKSFGYCWAKYTRFWVTNKCQHISLILSNDCTHSHFLFWFVYFLFPIHLYISTRRSFPFWSRHSSILFDMILWFLILCWKPFHWFKRLLYSVQTQILLVVVAINSNSSPLAHLWLVIFILYYHYYY